MKRHGLKNIRGIDIADGIKLNPRGEFQLFFKCISNEVHLYRSLSGTVSLLALYQSIQALNESYTRIYGTAVDERYTEIVRKFPAATQHFLLMFKLSSVARYYPLEWKRCIEGTTSGDVYIINQFVQISKRDFPVGVLNRFSDKFYEFRSVSRYEGVSDELITGIYK